MANTLKHESTRLYEAPHGHNPNIEQLKFGCLQRIADATEAMAKNHISLMRERDMYERFFNSQRLYGERLNRSNAALRGQITKLKKRIAELEKK